jgi:hypothetical protein
MKACLGTSYATGRSAIGGLVANVRSARLPAMDQPGLGTRKDGAGLGSRCEGPAWVRDEDGRAWLRVKLEGPAWSRDEEGRAWLRVKLRNRAFCDRRSTGLPAFACLDRLVAIPRKHARRCWWSLATTRDLAWSRVQLRRTGPG